MKYYKTIFGVVLAVLIFSYFLGFVVGNFPFRTIGLDSYSHLGSLRLLEYKMGLGSESLNQNMYPYLYGKDTHFGPYFYMIALISGVLKVDVVGVLFIFGILNLVVLFFSVFLIADLLLENKNKALLSALLFFLISPLIISFSGRDILERYLITAHYPSFFALSQLILLIYLNIRLKDKLDYSFIFLQSVIFMNLVLSHLFTAIAYAIFFVFFVIKNFYENRKQSVRLISGYSLALLVSLTWTLYNWFTFLIKQRPITGEDIPIELLNFDTFLGFFGIALIGLAYFVDFSGKKKPISLWLFAIILISFSYLLSFSLPLYYRFASFIKFSLIIGTCAMLFKDGIGKKFKVAVLFLLITSYVIFQVNAYESFTKKSFLSSDFPKIKNILEGKNKNVFSDEPLSEFLQTIPNTSVFLTSHGHVSDLSSVELNDQRVQLYKDFIGYSKEESLAFLKNYDLDYVLVRKNSAMLSKFADELGFGNSIEFEGKDYVLIRVKNDK